jgi:hypothetical protein
VKTSLQGSTTREDGETEFPLLPQYVGEDVRGFDNWYARRSKSREKEVPGTQYGPGKRPLDIKSVTYYSEVEREQSRVYVDGGKLTHGDSTPLGDGKWIFVVDRDGRLIAAPPRAGVIHHSSLSGGKPVLMAGEFEIVAGKVTVITNQSGHFRPSTAVFERFLVGLREQGLDLAGTRATALKFRTSANGGFSIDVDSTNLLEHPEALPLRGGHILAPLRAPDATNAAEHGGIRDNQPTTWELPRQIHSEGWWELLRRAA